jgi:hypothetical protein
MSHNDEDKKKIDALERRCTRLQEQLGKIKVEQVNYCNCPGANW